MTDPATPSTDPGLLTAAGEALATVERARRAHPALAMDLDQAADALALVIRAEAAP